MIIKLFGKFLIIAFLTSITLLAWGSGNSIHKVTVL